MSYYFTIENNEIMSYGECYCEGEGITCIEVTEKVYNAYRDDNDLYIYSNGEIIPNPDYEKIKREQEKQLRNSEIDSKIKELNEMAIPDILHGNKENIELYNEVIAGLEAAKL